MKIFHTGRQIPQIGYGTYCLNAQDCLNGVKFAIDCGYKHIDTASIYQNENEIGQVLQQMFNQQSIKRQQQLYNFFKFNIREDIFITSKLNPKEQGYENAIKATNQILQRLQLDYIDLLLIHWPGIAKLKLNDINHKNIRLGFFILKKETWRAMIELQQNGKVKDIGVSNFQINHLQHLLQNSNIKPVINQFEIHPLCIEEELIDFCQKNQILVESYSTLARNDEKLMKNNLIIQLAQKYQCKEAQLILKWALQRQFVIIPKSKTQQYIKENFILNFKISEEDIQQINQLNQFYRTCWNPQTVLH